MTWSEWITFLLPWYAWGMSMIALRLLPTNGPMVRGMRALAWGYWWYGLLLGLTDMLWGMGVLSTPVYVVWRKWPGRFPEAFWITVALWHWRIPRGRDLL